MRQSYRNAYSDLHALNTKRDILNMPPISEQEQFVQVLGNILLLNNGEEIGSIEKLLNDYKGSYSNLVLTTKFIAYSMEKQTEQNYNAFPLLKMLSKWIDTLESLKKKKKIMLYPAVIESLDKGISSYQQFIIYLNYISLDLLQLINQESSGASNHLDQQDLIQFLKAILPKIIVNLSVPRTFFPQTLLKTNSEFIDLLYCQQNLLNLIHSRHNYALLTKSTFKVLLALQLQPNQIKQLIISSFNYYYLFHQQKSHGASQIIIESFKKMTRAVRYALLDQIIMFMFTLKKLGKDLFINYINDKFDWIGQINRDHMGVGLNKSAINPFHNKFINNSQQIRVDPGKTVHRYIEIYDRFSLLYFSLSCVGQDISIRFYYIGDFDKSEGFQKKLLFGSEKKQGVFQGSIEAIEKGIYMFELDNTYSWMKAKTVLYNTAIMVPLQIREHKENSIKQIIYGRNHLSNQIQYEQVLGWVDENQIKLHASSGNVTRLEDNGLVVFNVKITKNSGGVYQYETQSRGRFIKKIEKIEKESQEIFWMINQCRIQSISRVQEWLHGQYQPVKPQHLRNLRNTQTENLQQMGYHNLSEQQDESSQQQKKTLSQTPVEKEPELAPVEKEPEKQTTEKSQAQSRLQQVSQCNIQKDQEQQENISKKQEIQEEEGQ